MFVFRAVREVLYKVLKYSNVNRSCINILSNKNNFPIIVRESGKGWSQFEKVLQIAENGLGSLYPTGTAKTDTDVIISRRNSLTAGIAF
jgi:hypothetical protein